jgi:hypothetical protein
LKACSDAATARLDGKLRGFVEPPGHVERGVRGEHLGIQLGPATADNAYPGVLPDGVVAAKGPSHDDRD